MDRDSRIIKIESCKQNTFDVPYKFIWNNIDFTPQPIDPKMFKDSNKQFDITSLFSLYPNTFNEVARKDSNHMITGLLSGTKYGPSVFPVEKILSHANGDVSTFNYDCSPSDGKFKLLNEKPIKKTFKILLQETNTIDLFTQESILIEIKIIPFNEETVEESEYEFFDVSQEYEYGKKFYNNASKEISNKIQKFNQFDAAVDGPRILTKEMYTNTDNYKFRSQCTISSEYLIFSENLNITKNKMQNINGYFSNRESSNVLGSPIFEYNINVLKRALNYDCVHSQIIYKYPDSTKTDDKNLYNLTLLWIFRNPTRAKHLDCEVTSISWHPLNEDLLAVGYGKKHAEKTVKGAVCLWNIKEPKNPDRVFKFDHPVTCVSFFNKYPYTLTVAFYNGHIAIINILLTNLTYICHTFETITDYLPITHLIWHKKKNMILTSTQSGGMSSYQIIWGLEKQLVLDLPQQHGVTKGIKQYSRYFRGKTDCIPNNIAICTFTVHPSNSLLYLVGTADGIIHYCSLLCKSSTQSSFVAHEGPINCIEFHPQSDKIFLTSGSDFYIRIWGYKILKPLIEITYRKSYIHYSMWVAKNPMLIVSLHDKFIDIWDLRRKLDASPVTSFTKEDMEADFVHLSISPCSQNILVGDSKGNVTVLSLREMNYHSHFTFIKFIKVLKRHIKYNNYTLWLQVESLGSEFKLEDSE